MQYAQDFTVNISYNYASPNISFRVYLVILSHSTAGGAAIFYLICTMAHGLKNKIKVLCWCCVHPWKWKHMLRPFSLCRMPPYIFLSNLKFFEMFIAYTECMFRCFCMLTVPFLIISVRLNWSPIASMSQTPWCDSSICWVDHDISRRLLRKWELFGQKLCLKSGLKFSLISLKFSLDIQFLAAC